MHTTTAWLLIGIVSLTAISVWLFTYLRSQRPAGPRLAVPPVYTKHAKERMVQRQVRQHQIEQVLAKPERQIPDRENDSVRLERQFDGRTLKVWVVAEPWQTAKAATVKTTAWADLVQTFEIPAGQTGLVIGLGGSTVRQIEAASNTRISIDKAGLVRVSADRFTSLEKAKQLVFGVIDSAGVTIHGDYRAA